MASGYEERKRLTFEQAERIEPLPTQLALKEISTELRSRLWDIVYTRMGRSTQEVRPTPPSRRPGRDAILIDPWRIILYKKHIERDFKPADEFDRRFEP